MPLICALLGLRPLHWPFVRLAFCRLLSIDCSLRFQHSCRVCVCCVTSGAEMSPILLAGQKCLACRTCGAEMSRMLQLRGRNVLHVSSFQKDFNDMVDDYRQAKKAGDAKAALLSKDKTRPLQFIPGIHVFEQGLLHPLSIAGVSVDQWQNLSPEDMVRKVAAVNPDVFCQNFRPSSVPASASQHSVDAAFSLSRWFQSVYHFSINAAQKLEDFRRDRLMKTDLPQPSAQAFAHTLQKAPGFFSRSSCMDPPNIIFCR